MTGRIAAWDRSVPGDPSMASGSPAAIALFVALSFGWTWGSCGLDLPLMPRLSLRFGWRWATLIVGSVWALWHLPLFFIPGMAQTIPSARSLSKVAQPPSTAPRS